MYERLVVAGAIHVAESERHGSEKNRDTLKNAANRFLQLTRNLGSAFRVRTDPLLAAIRGTS